MVKDAAASSVRLVVVVRPGGWVVRLLAGRRASSWWWKFPPGELPHVVVALIAGLATATAVLPFGSRLSFVVLVFERRSSIVGCVYSIIGCIPCTWNVCWVQSFQSVMKPEMGSALLVTVYQ